MSTLILLPLFFSSFAFLACACCESDFCSPFGCRTSVRACIPPQKCSLRAGPWGCVSLPALSRNRLKLCVTASRASSSVWEQGQSAGGGCRPEQGQRAAWAVAHSMLTLSFQETSPEDGGCGLWKWERRNSQVGFYSCIVSSTGEVSTSLLSA